MTDEGLTLKAPITTAAENNFTFIQYFFFFSENKVLTFQVMIHMKCHDLFLSKLDHEVSICSLIPPAMAISIARTTEGNNSKGPGPMALIFFPTIQLVILVMCTKFQVSR